MLAGRRGPLIAGGAVAAVVLLLVFFLVLPKMSQVTQAQDDLEAARGQTNTLEAQLAALQQAEAEAPEARKVIEDVDRKLPPTADLPGLILSIKNAATQASVTMLSLTPGDPVADPTTGLSTITVTVTAEGSYFAVTEFMFNIETLPRAAKVQTLALSPVSTETFSTVQNLTATSTMVLFTQDTSAGPGSEPGPNDTGAEG